MSREIYRRRHRTGLVSADIVRPGVDDLAELSTLAPNDVWDGTLIHVRDLNAIYSYDLESTDPDDGLNVITPATGVGRWLKIGFGGAGTGSTADKWVDVTKITSSETVTVDKTAESDWPQETVRELVDVEGTLDVVEGYVLVGPQNLAEVLETYNQTQGSSVLFSSGDNLFLSQGAPPTTAAGQGSFFVGDGTGGTTAGQPYFREENSGAVTLLTPSSSTSYDFVRENIPNTNQGGSTIVYEGYVSVPCTLTQIVVFMKTLNTAGAYTATFTNVTTGNTLLGSASFDMQTLTADTWTVLTLTSTGGDLAFAGGNRYRASFVSDNASFDGTGIYFNLRFTVT